MQNIIRRRK